MIVTIDGPAGAGKSSAARALAQQLGFRFLDTGAMYRAVTLAALRAGVDLEDEAELEKIAASLDLTLENDRVLLDGKDVTREIRTFEVTTATRYAADAPGVRARLVEWQRHLSKDCDVVAEGRDQATVVFPNAECKIYLTASESIRAERRFLDLVNRGEHVSRQEVLDKQRVRDERDCSRPVGPLFKADDAIEVSTDGLSPDDVVARLLAIVESHRPAADRPTLSS